MNTTQEQNDIITDCTDIIAEFFENIIQTLLCVRSVYPRELFIETVSSVTGQIVLTSRHPVLSKYVKNLVSSFKPWIQMGLIDKVSVSIHGNTTSEVPERRKVEEYVFEVSDLRVNPFEQVDIDSQLFGPFYWALREFFVHLHNVPPIELREIDPESISFDVFVQADRSSQLQLPANLDWSIHTTDEMNTSECVITPVKSMNNAEMGIKMQLYQKRWL
jgi:hypothetical protein